MWTSPGGGSARAARPRRRGGAETRRRGRDRRGGALVDRDTTDRLAGRRVVGGGIGEVEPGEVGPVTGADPSVGRTVIGVENVVAAEAAQDVRARTPDDRVVAIVAGQRVIARAAVGREPEQAVVALAPDDGLEVGDGVLAAVAASRPHLRD